MGVFRLPGLCLAPKVQAGEGWHRGSAGQPLGPWQGAADQAPAQDCPGQIRAILACLRAVVVQIVT